MIHPLEFYGPDQDAGNRDGGLLFAWSRRKKKNAGVGDGVGRLIVL